MPTLRLPVPIRSALAVACVLAAAAVSPGRAAVAQEAPAPALGSASLSAVAYAAAPRPSYVEVVLADDSPDNVRLAWETHNLLQKAGWLADKGPTLRLTLDTYTIGAAGTAEPPQGGKIRDGRRGSGKPPAGTGAGQQEELYVLGVLEGGLVDVASGQTIWEGRAVYRMNNGDLPLGAVALAPLFVEALGRNLSNEPVRLE